MGTQKQKSEDRYPVYLIVADGTAEFENAMHFSAKNALFAGARLAVLYVMPSSERVFMPWQTVSDHIEAGARHAAEDLLQNISAQLNEYGLFPSLYLRSGNPREIIRDLVNNDKTITKLILAGDTSAGNPGPLVSYFSSGRGLAELQVPLTIVPSHIDVEAYKHFFEQID